MTDTLRTLQQLYARMRTSRVLIAEGAIGTTIATLYASTQGKTHIDAFALTNTSAGTVLVNLYLVPNGGTAGVANKFYDARPIAAHTTDGCPELVGHLLDRGESIQAQTGVPTVIFARASGEVEI